MPPDARQNLFPLYLAAFLAISGVAAFYNFYGYLESIGTPAPWRGFVIGLEPLAAFLVRPLAAARLNAKNARRGMRLGLCGLIVVLPGYALLPHPLAAASLRLAHGAAFAIFFSALIAIFVTTIPKKHSGRAFGALSLITLLPYALIPALIGFLAPERDQAAWVYAVMALVMAPAFFLASDPGRKPAGEANAAPDPDAPVPGPTIRQALKLPGLRPLLAASLLLVTAQMAAFFFLKPFAAGIGLPRPELFFTIMTATCLLSRLVANPFFDRMPKRLVVAGAATVTGLAYLVLARTTGPALFYAAAVALGLAQALSAPLINALAYDLSPAPLKGLCVNLMLATLDAGLFVGPWLGGAVLALGHQPAGIFYPCAVCALAAAACLPRPRPAPAPDRDRSSRQGG